MLHENPSRMNLEEELENLLFSHGIEAALCRFKEGNVFRTGLRDLLGIADAERVGKELSLIADVCVAFVLKNAMERTRMRYGEFFCPFGVVGLGKAGGRELGYGSDLDLLFVYAPSSANASGEDEIFSSVASEVIKQLKEKTRFGTLYDVDARLRPYGKQGALVMRVHRMQEYYVKEAQGWERLALLKARCLAGTYGIEELLKEQLKRIFHEAYLGYHDLENVLKLRERLAAESTKNDLKKSPGGTLDVEFIARLLQWHCIQEFPLGEMTGTLEVLDILSKIGVLPVDETRVLCETYLFLRRVENRLRIADGMSLSVLPDDEAELQDLSRRLSLSRNVLEEVKDRQQQVKNIYDRVVRQLKRDKANE